MKYNLNYYLKHTAPNGDCLEWTRCFNSDGYPRAGHSGNTNWKVHREVYKLTHPEEDITNKLVRHTCDNTTCINPTHLLSGTTLLNNQDRDLRKRSGKNKISWEDVQQIRSMYIPGKITQTEIGRQFGINNRTVSSIICGHHWKYVPQQGELKFAD